MPLLKNALSNSEHYNFLFSYKMKYVILQKKSQMTSQFRLRPSTTFTKCLLKKYQKCLMFTN